MLKSLFLSDTFPTVSKADLTLASQEAIFFFFFAEIKQSLSHTSRNATIAPFLIFGA